MNVRQTWRVFLVQLELARAYPTAYVLVSVRVVPRNPILEWIIPSLLHIKMMAILDEAFEDYIDDKGLVPEAKYKKTLCGRISFLGDKGLIGNSVSLHEARERRNKAAHGLSSDLSWEQLDTDLLEVHGALQAVGLVGVRPDITVTGERSALRKSTESGVVGERDYLITAHDGAKVAAEYKWTERLLEDGDLRGESGDTHT